MQRGRKMEWKYVVLPIQIARFHEGKLEVRSLQTDEWVDHTFSAEYWKMIEEDGFTVDEEKAEEIHQQLKKKYL